MSRRQLRKLQNQLNDVNTQLVLAEVQREKATPAQEQNYSWLAQRLARFEPSVEVKIAQLNKWQHNLTQQIARLEQRLEREVLDPPFTTRLREHIAGQQDLRDELKDRVQAPLERTRRWVQNTFQHDLNHAAQMTERERAVQRFEADLQRYFPDQHQAHQREKEVQARAVELKSQYWQDRVKAAEMSRRHRERRDAWAARRELTEQRRQWQAEQTELRQASAQRRADEMDAARDYYEQEH